MKTKTCFMVSVLRIWHSSINVSTENTFRRLNSFFIRGVIFVWLDGPFSLLSCDWCGSYGSRILERWPWCNGRRWSRKIGLSSYTTIGTSVTSETHICNAWKMIIWIWTFLSLGFPSKKAAFSTILSNITLICQIRIINYWSIIHNFYSLVGCRIIQCIRRLCSHCMVRVSSSCQCISR